MNAKDLAAQLNGSQYPLHIDRSLAKAAKEAGLVIVYGASDDLMEFEGAIYEELGAYNGTIAYVTREGFVLNQGADGFEELVTRASTIHALWCQEGEYSWTYRTDIPHECFEITEEGEPPYCRGIVFALADVARAQTQ